MSVFLPGQSSDDGFAYLTTLYLTDNFVELGDGGGGVEYPAGVRFVNVAIPKNATILTAKLTLQAYDTRTNTVCNVKIKGEDVDDAATFSTYANFAARARTTQYVNWDAIPAWTANTDYDSPDIKNIIQAIISRAGWVSGNNLVLFFTNNVEGLSGQNRRIY